MRHEHDDARCVATLSTSLPNPSYSLVPRRSLEWHRMLKEDGVKVWCLSPGFLATGLGGDQEANKSVGAGDPTTAGQFVRTVLEGQRDADVGRVLLRDGLQPW